MTRFVSRSEYPTELANHLEDLDVNVASVANMLSGLAVRVAKLEAEQRFILGAIERLAYEVFQEPEHQDLVLQLKERLK